MATLRETIPLQKAKILKGSIRGTIGTMLFCGFLSVVVYFAGFRDVIQIIIGAPVISSFLLVAFLLFQNPVYQCLYFKRYFYDMDEKNIIIRKGALAQTEITLPFSRITDVYVDQDMFDVLFKIYDVHISTPTAQSGFFAHIDGINREGAQKLRVMLLNKINQEDS